MERVKRWLDLGQWLVIGAVIDQVRPNWFFGIRTPWTLSSEVAWSETHRAGRLMFVAMGVAIALAGIFQAPWALYMAMLVCLAGRSRADWLLVRDLATHRLR
jgi:immunity protein, SdpI family